MLYTREEEEEKREAATMMLYICVGNSTILSIKSTWPQY